MYVYRFIAAKIALCFVVASLTGLTQANAGSFLTDVPSLGYAASNMDLSVSPRNDFYRYAAGNWLKRAVIPASEADLGSFTLLADNLDKQLLTLIKDAANTSNLQKGSPRQQVGDFYKAAINLKHLDELGIKPLEGDLQHIAASEAKSVDYAALSARLQPGYGVSPLVNAAAMVDAKNSTTRILLLMPGIQMLEQDEYSKPEHQHLRDLYKNYIAAMLKSIGQPANEAAVNAGKILAIETKIATARLTLIQMRDPSKTYNMMSLEKAQALIPGLDLRVFLKNLGVVAPDTVQVFDIEGLKAVQKVLAEQPAEEIKNLFRWTLLASRASALGRPWRLLDEEFNRVRKGLKTVPVREREITRQISAQLFHPLSQLYVQAYFPDSTKREITDMVGHIKDEFTERLRSNAWLDEPTRAAALDKLARIDIQVGYPKEWVDFSRVDIRSDDYFGNVQRISSFLFQRELAQIGKPVQQDRFAYPGNTTPISVNAAYNPSINGIDITAAIVQPPFYKQGADAAVNYCTIGAVIGHEITHGFDSFGRQYDPAGNLRDWWTPQATEKFKKRTDVLVDQYNHYEVLPGLMHNGAQTLTENTADLGGITLAHAALQRYLAKNPLPKIDGLTADQRCFVAWSQMWAYKARSERLRYLVSADYHAISSIRSVAPLQHLDAFYKAFDIRKGDPMWRAPEKRVTIW